MSRFLVLLCVILLQKATAINVTNSGNQQEIKDIKKDLTTLRSLVISLNNSLISTQIDKDEKVKEMNATIQAQQVEMRLMNSTIYAQQQEMNASNQDYQRELRTMNATIQAQKQVERSMNTTIETQQKEVTYLISTVQDQQHKMTLMEANIQILKKENQTLHDELKSFQKNNSAEIGYLKEANEKGNQNYEAFQVIVQDLVTNVNTLKNTSRQQISRMHDNLTSLVSQVHYSSLSFLDAQKILKDLENSTKETERNITSIFNILKSKGQDNHDLQSGGKRTVAFTVSTSSSLISSIGKTIIYNKVITNKGGAYNSNTGIFTCPSPGTYVFTWSTMSAGGAQMCTTYIMHNGNRLLKSESYESTSGSQEVASNTIVLALTVGDRVLIETDRGRYCYGYPYTGFSGWKL